MEVLVYECPSCEDLVIDGDICCEPKRFTAYQCSRCKTIYIYKNNAENCECEEE